MGGARAEAAEGQCSGLVMVWYVFQLYLGLRVTGGMRDSGRTMFGVGDGGLSSANEPGTTNTRPATLYDALLQLKVSATESFCRESFLLVTLQGVLHQGEF